MPLITAPANKASRSGQLGKERRGDAPYLKDLKFSVRGITDNGRLLHFTSRSERRNMLDKALIYCCGCLCGVFCEVSNSLTRLLHHELVRTSPLENNLSLESKTFETTNLRFTHESSLMCLPARPQQMQERILTNISVALKMTCFHSVCLRV